MKILKGNRIENIEADELKNKLKAYKSIIIDIGTGDGSFPYRKASKDKENLYIGLDSAADNMVNSSIKVGKKTARGGLNNVLYVVCNALDIPEELKELADRTHINLPWGSLRDAVVKGDEGLLEGIRRMSKEHSSLDVYVTYDTLYEAKEIMDRKLPHLSLDYINTHLKNKYTCWGIDIKKAEVCSNDDLKGLETQWAKKLAYGRKRDIYHLSCLISN